VLVLFLSLGILRFTSRLVEFQKIGGRALDPGEITPSYILHTRAFGTYLLGGYLPCKKDYKVMVFYM
jgi:hypothetical protein